VAPHIAAPIPAESATQTASAVGVTAKAVTGNTTEGAGKVIAAKAISCATATMAAASGKCAGGKPETSENKDNCKNNYDFAQH
jgi:hypothetical protein